MHNQRAFVLHGNARPGFSVSFAKQGALIARGHTMDSGPLSSIIWIAAIVIVAILFVRHRRRRGRIGAGAAGSVYDWLNEDKRKAVETIVEERAGARDAEDKDGNLPDLEKPTRPSH
jgi:hypothetical protein